MKVVTGNVIHILYFDVRLYDPVTTVYAADRTAQAGYSLTSSLNVDVVVHCRHNCSYREVSF